METIKKYHTSDFKLKDKVIINLGEAGKGIKSFWVDGIISDTHPNRITVQRKNPFGNELLEEQIPNKLLTSEYIVKEEDAEMYADGGSVGKNYKIKLFWKGLSGNDRKIGEYVVSENSLDKLEEQHKHELDIDVIDETTEKPISYTILIDKLIKSGKEKGLFANGGEVNEFDYMMLGRLKSDADYYLGYGNRNEKVLWALNVDDHIQEMKNRWNALPEDKKPEWLTMEDILEYEKKMKNPTKSKFSYYKVPNEELYAIQECNPEYKDGFGSECIVIRTKKTEEAAIAEVERLNKLGYSDYAKGGELPQQKNIDILQKGLENPLIPQNVKTKIEAKIKELQADIRSKQEEAKKAAEKPTLKDLEARLKIVKKMAAKKPELKARVKILEKMIAKEEKNKPSKEEFIDLNIDNISDELKKDAAFYFSDKYNLTKIDLMDELVRYTQMQKDFDAKKITPSQVIGKGHKPQYARGIADKWIKDRIALTKYLIKNFDELNQLTETQKKATPKMENGGEFDLELGGYEYKMISSPTISYLRKEYKEELKNPEYSIIELPKQHPDRKRGNKFGLFKKKNRLTDHVNSFRNALVSYIKERYNEDVDLDNTLISYVENTNNKQVERAEVTTLQGNEYTVYPADLVDRFKNGGSIPVNVALQTTAGQPYEIIKNDIPRTEAQKFIEEYKQSGKPYHNIMIDDLPFEDGGGVPEELKGYRVEIYTSYDGNQPFNIVSNGQFKNMVLVTDGKTGDSSVVMSNEPYLRLQTKNVFGNIHTSVVPVNIADKKWKMFGGNFVWSSDSRFREEVSEHPLPLHDRVEYEGGGEINKYIIFEGYDHYNQKPLYQVLGKNNDYVGEWHDDRKDAEEELEDLQPKMKKGGETWIQDSVDKMEKKGTVGSFVNKAARHGLTPIEYAKKVLANPDKHTEKTRRQAQFVKNTNLELFKDGGKVKGRGIEIIPIKAIEEAYKNNTILTYNGEEYKVGRYKSLTDKNVPYFLVPVNSDENCELYTLVQLGDTRHERNYYYPVTQNINPNKKLSN